MARKSERPRTTFCSHHHQGISLSADSKARIDFEKTCGTDLFCNSVPSKGDKKDIATKKALIFKAFFVFVPRKPRDSRVVQRRLTGEKKSSVYVRIKTT